MTKNRRRTRRRNTRRRQRTQRRYRRKRGGGEETIEPGEEAALRWTLQQHEDFMRRSYGNLPGAEEHINAHIGKESEELAKYYP